LGEILKVVLEKDGDQLNMCVKNEEVLQRPSGKEYPTYNKRKEGYLDWSHLTYELPSKTCY
jgi:hypothetical protein